jgi:glycosyltransferase involved in cell wall biosynthesis
VKVSIVTPSYNQAQFLEETILSVLDQDYGEIEYVLVEGGSADSSLEIARRYEGRLDKLLVQENVSQVTAINYGFSHTEGELMAYLNSDDTLLPGAVAEMVAAFEAEPALVMVYGDALYTDAESRQTGYLASRSWDPPRMVRNCDNHVVQPSSMWRRSAWEQAGPFDERGYYFFDFELYLRFSALGPVKRIPRPWSTYREHAASKTVGDQVGKARDYLRFADSFLTSDRLPQELRPYAREGRARARVAAGNNLYGQLELGLARRCLWSAILIDPRAASPSLALKSLLPKPIVRRLRARRNAARRG